MEKDNGAQCNYTNSWKRIPGDIMDKVLADLQLRLSRWGVLESYESLFSTQWVAIVETESGRILTNLKDSKG